MLLEEKMAEENILVVSVPEVVTSEDGKTLVFRVTTEFRVRHTDLVSVASVGADIYLWVNEDNQKYNVTRAHNQFVALQAKIAEANKTKLVPVVPEPPNASMIADKDHLEKKRRQYDRFLSRLTSKPEFANNTDLRAFLTATSYDDKKSASTINKMMNIVTVKTDNGFRIYKPTQIVDEAEESDFDKRRGHVLQSERDHKALLEGIANVVRTRAALGRSIAAWGNAVSEIDFPKPFSQASKSAFEFGVQLSNLHHEQSKEEIFHFGDVFLEYKNNANAFRLLLNNRTDLLADIDTAIKTQQKTASNIEATKKKFPETSSEVLKAIEDDDKAKQNIKDLQAQYLITIAAINAEYEAYGVERLENVYMALDHFVRTQITAEQDKLATLIDFYNKIPTV